MGWQGATGMQGPKGEKGNTGATGEQGPPGLKGQRQTLNGYKGDPGWGKVLLVYLFILTAEIPFTSC